MANTAVVNRQQSNVYIQEPQYNPSQSQYANNTKDLLEVLQKIEKLKVQKAEQNIQTSQTLKQTYESNYDTGRLDYQHYEKYNKIYKTLKLGIDPSMAVSKIHPGLSLPVGMLWSQGLLYPAKYGYMNKSFVYGALHHFMPGLTPDILTGLVLTHYMLQKSPDVLKSIYERNKARLTYGNTLPLTEHAYQSYRILNDFTKLFYIPMISLMTAGLLGKGLGLASSFAVSGISHLPLALKLASAPTLLPLQGLSIASNIINATGIPNALIHAGALAGKYLNPFKTLFPVLGNITGLNSLANYIAYGTTNTGLIELAKKYTTQTAIQEAVKSGAISPEIAKTLMNLGGIHNLPLVGNLLSSIITHPAVPVATVFAATGMITALARSFAMRKYRPKNVNAYELEQQTSASYQLQPLLMQLISRDNRVVPISVLQLQTLMLIEQHTSIIPLLYNLLHQSSEIKRTGSEEGRDIIYGKQVEPEDIYWFEKPQKFLEKLRVKYDPFTQLINYIATGKNPREFIKEILEREKTRNEERQKISKELGISYTTASLLGTNALYLISQAKSYESKVIALLSGIYDLNRSQLSELMAIRKYGFGIKESINVELNEPFQKSFINIIGDTVKGIVKYNFNVYKGIYKYLRGQREEAREIFKDIKTTFKETFTEAPVFNALYNSVKVISSIPKLFKKETYIDLKEKVKQRFSKQKQIEEIQLSINEQQLELDKRQIDYLESMDSTLQGIYLILRDIYKSFLTILPKNIRDEKEKVINAIDKYLAIKRRAITERLRQKESIEEEPIKISVKYDQKKHPDYIEQFIISPVKRAVSPILEKLEKKKVDFEQYIKNRNRQIKHTLLSYSYNKPTERLLEEISKVNTTDIFNLIKNTIKEIKHIPKFAKGGEVPGIDTGKDKIVSILRPGEFVLSHDHLRELGKKYIKEIITNVKAKSESLLQRQKEVSQQYEKVEEKRYKKSLLEYIGGIYQLLKKGLSYSKEQQKKQEDGSSIFDILSGAFGVGYLYGKKFLGKVSAIISEKLIKPLFIFFTEKVIPASIKNFTSNISGKLGSSFIGKLLGKLFTKGAAKIGLRALPFGIGAVLAEGLTGGSTIDVIGAGLGGAIGGALGLVGGPIGEFFGSIIGAEIGKFLLNKIWDFVTLTPKYIKDKAKAALEWFEKKFEDFNFDKIINFILKPFEYIFSLPIKLFKTIKSGISKLFKGAIWLLKKIPGVGEILDRLGIGTEGSSKITTGSERLADIQLEIAGVKQNKADTSIVHTVAKHLKSGYHKAKETAKSIFNWFRSKIFGDKPEQKAADIITGSDILAQAQLEAESSLNPYAVSPKGAKGIAQFMPKTWEYIWTNKDKFAKYNPELKNFEGIPDIFDVKAQKAAYKAYMNYLREKFGGSIQWALAAYNWGEGNVKRLYEKYHGNFSLAFAHLPRETQKYVKKILSKAQSVARKIESTNFYNTLKQHAESVKKDVYNTIANLTKTEEPTSTTKEQTTKETTTTEVNTQVPPQTANIAQIKEIIDTKTILFINKLFDNSLFAFEEYIYKNIFDQYN